MPASVRPHYLDVTEVTARNEVADAFGERAAWEATIVRLTAKEARERNPYAKRKLRLMLLNAQTQLSLIR